MADESPTVPSSGDGTHKTARPRSRAAWWAGWILSALLAAFLLLGAVMNIIQPPFVVESSREMGFSEDVLLPLGIVSLVSVVLYMVPRTSAMGCIVFTGYLGGAVAVHVGHGDPILQTLFPVLFAALLWLGLVLRYPLLRAGLFQPDGRRSPATC